MKRTTCLIILGLVIISARVFISDFRYVKASSRIVYVDDDNVFGPWDGTLEHPYQNITSGVQYASDNDTILVRDGIYYENIHLDKSVSLIGENKNSTVINANFTDNAISIMADGVNISDFTISNADLPSSLGVGVSVENSEYCNISNNIITDSFYGIRLTAANNNILSNNLVPTSSDRIGIALYYSSENNIIANNTISSAYMAILLSSSNQNRVSRNKVCVNHYGIRLANSSNNTIVTNEIITNNKGIYIASYTNPSVDNLIYHNNFVNNTDFQAGEYNSTNIWDAGYPSGGNYWSNYNGTDLFIGPYQNVTGSDGKGDTPYFVSYLNNSDRYPLMNAWVTETLRGDVNHDGKVDILDIVTITSIYGSKQGDADWNQMADIAPPYGVINIFDLVTCASQYGKTS